MSVEQTVSLNQGIEQRLTNMAAQGIRLARLVVLRSAILIAGDAANYTEETVLATSPPHLKTPSLELEVEVRRSKIMENCRLAFEFAIESHMNSEDTYIKPIYLGPNKSEYIGVESPKNNPLTLHRPTIFNEGTKRYAYWLREKVETSEANLDLPSYYYREFGIDAQGNLEEKVRVDAENFEYRKLDVFESLPYYRALAPVRVQKIISAESAALPSES